MGVLRHSLNIEYNKLKKLYERLKADVNKENEEAIESLEKQKKSLDKFKRALDRYSKGVEEVQTVRLTQKQLLKILTSKAITKEAAIDLIADVVEKQEKEILGEMGIVKTVKKEI